MTDGGHPAVGTKDHRAPAPGYATVYPNLLPGAARALSRHLPKGSHRMSELVLAAYAMIVIESCLPPC